MHTCHIECKSSILHSKNWWLQRISIWPILTLWLLMEFQRYRCISMGIGLGSNLYVRDHKVVVTIFHCWMNSNFMNRIVIKDLSVWVLYSAVENIISTHDKRKNHDRLDEYTCNHIILIDGSDKTHSLWFRSFACRPKPRFLSISEKDYHLTAFLWRHTFSYNTTRVLLIWL